MRNLFSPVFVVVVLALMIVACDKANPVSPTPGPIPGPELDTSWRRLVDGAGNPGPIVVRLLHVQPTPGSRVITHTDGIQGSFEAEVCMDIPPNNSSWFSMVTVWPMWSRDGLTSAPEGRPLVNATGTSVRIGAGECRIASGPVSPVGSAIPFNTQYILIVGNWGPNLARGATELYTWNNEACPPGPFSGMDASKPCFFRVAYNLNYQW